MLVIERISSILRGFRPSVPASAVVVAIVAIVVAGGNPLHAQPPPWYDRAPQQQQSQQRDPLCLRLEGQLAAIDRGGADPQRAEQARRYEDAAARQQGDLDRMVEQSRRLGCERTGFFLFGGGQPPQCDQLRSQIEQARMTLDRMATQLEQLRGGGDRTRQRQAVLVALAQNGCGAQYQNAAPPPQQARPRGLFETLFGSAVPPPPEESMPQPGLLPGEMPPSGSFRTVCVRKCDGSFFPISYGVGQGRFPQDEQTCRRACPATDVDLYVYRSPGEEIGQAMSVTGQPYTALPNAFRYRQQYDANCACKRPGESWAAVVRDDPTVERGDIVVTDEKAKAMSQPRTTQPAARTQQRPPQQRSQRTTPPTQRPAQQPRPLNPELAPR